MVERVVKVRGPVWRNLFAPAIEGRWGDIPREQLLEGPAGTGKSMGIGFWLDWVARTWAGCRILVVRKTRVSLSQSWMASFESKVLNQDDLLQRGTSRSHRDAYVYANGSEIVMGGMDNETKLFSTEYDVIYVNEANELSQGEVESLHRALRNGVLPFQVMVLDCNPDSEFHWLNQRCISGPTKRRPTRLHDNPGYWTADGWTTGGAQYLASLKETLTGIRYMRLVQGLWVTAEGTIIDIDRQRHVLPARVEFPPYKRPRIVVDGRDGHIEVSFFYGAVDWGFRNPGVLQVWAVDDAKRAYLVREVYQTEKGEDWWAGQVVELDGQFQFRRVVCDSARPEHIQKFNRVLREARDRRGLRTTAVAIPAKKGQQGGKTWLEVQAQLMRRAFERADDGLPRAYLFADALVGEKDPALTGKPTRFLEEAVQWTYEVYDAAKHKGHPKEIGDPSKPNHAIDAASYGFEWLWDNDRAETAEERWGNQPVQAGSWAEADKYWKRAR